MKKKTARTLAGLWVVVPLAVVAACGSSSTGPSSQPFDMTSVDFAPSLGVDLSQMDSLGDQLYAEDLQVGDDTLTATTGDTLTVDYEAWLSDGTKFDSSLDRDSTFTFVLGLDNLITGFTRGVGGMRVGGVRLIVIPPDLGYGAQDYGPIPGNSALVFKVWLRDLGRVGVPKAQTSGASEGS